MLLSELLHEYRKRLKLTQKEAAAKLSITREHYAKVEEGRSAAPIGLLRRIARLLGTDLAILVEAREEKIENALPPPTDVQSPHCIIVSQKADHGHNRPSAEVKKLSGGGRRKKSEC